MGSGAAGGLTATCKRTAEGWVLNGEKNGLVMPHLLTSLLSGQGIGRWRGKRLYCGKR